VSHDDVPPEKTTIREDSGMSPVSLGTRVISAAAIQRAREKAVKLLGGNRELAVREMRHKLSRETRPALEVALEGLSAEGVVTARDGGNQRIVYRLTREGTVD
jgi:DNA-binding transcriptional ArsR family regulator